MSKVLILTNDFQLKKFLELSLKFNGFVAHFVDDSAGAWKFLEEAYFDFIIIDFQLSKESGLAFFKSLRQFGANIPVLMVGEGEFDEFMLKDLSPDNYSYILKPFKFRELRQIINSLINGIKEESYHFSLRDLRIDATRGVVILKDNIFLLGKMEIQIFLALAKKAGAVVSSQRIKAILEKEGTIYRGTPFYHISKLRNKLRMIVGDSIVIKIISGEGYRLDFKTT